MAGCDIVLSCRIDRKVNENGAPHDTLAVQEILEKTGTKRDADRGIGPGTPIMNQRRRAKGKQQGLAVQVFGEHEDFGLVPTGFRPDSGAFRAPKHSVIYRRVPIGFPDVKQM
jgi:hypothetical protein